LLGLPRHDRLRRLVQHLNGVYKTEPALWELDDTHEGFEWIDFHDADNSVVAFMRRSRGGDVIVFAVNATPLVRQGYRLGVPGGGFYREIINTDAETYGGTIHNYRRVQAFWVALRFDFESGVLFGDGSRGEHHHLKHSTSCAQFQIRTRPSYYSA
jgi:1,4-alpha-glucan branching enzyme